MVAILGPGGFGEAEVAEESVEIYLASGWSLADPPKADSDDESSKEHPKARRTTSHK